VDDEGTVNDPFGIALDLVAELAAMMKKPRRVAMEALATIAQYQALIRN
jgi:hypothetical protein